jgi:hypothetical protein
VYVVVVPSTKLSILLQKLSLGPTIPLTVSVYSSNEQSERPPGDGDFAFLALWQEQIELEKERAVALSR